MNTNSLCKLRVYRFDVDDEKDHLAAGVQSRISARAQSTSILRRARLLPSRAFPALSSARQEPRPPNFTIERDYALTADYG